MSAGGHPDPGLERLLEAARAGAGELGEAIRAAGNVYLPAAELEGGPRPYEPHPGDVIEPLEVDGLLLEAVTYNGRPAAIFRFVNAKADIALPPLLLTCLDGLPELVRDVVALARKGDGYDPRDPTTHPDYAGPGIDAEGRVTCPGCGRRLFGERADLGYCSTCPSPEEAPPHAQPPT